MADVPTNEKLYALVVMQAKAKYRIYPSPGASHWVHRRYIELGGKFEDTAEKAKREEIMKRYIEARKDKAAHGDHDPRTKDHHAKDKKDKKDKK
jgi:hypothetical protein